MSSATTTIITAIMIITIIIINLGLCSFPLQFTRNNIIYIYIAFVCVLCVVFTRALYVYNISPAHTPNRYSADSTPTAPVARNLRLGGGESEQQTFRWRRQIVNDVTVGTYNPIINDIADLKPVIKSPCCSRRRDDWRVGCVLSDGRRGGGHCATRWQTGGRRLCILVA